MDAGTAQEDSLTFPACDADALPWITVAQMREVDRIAIELGVTLPRMMENAGAHLALVALALLGGDVRGRRIAVLVGRGGNGGGGLVAARRLVGWGAEVGVHLSDEPDALAPVPREQLEILRAMRAPVAVGANGVAAPELFLDAILGYGQRRSARGGAAELIAATAGARVLALDVPSGPCARRGHGRRAGDQSRGDDDPGAAEGRSARRWRATPGRPALRRRHRNSAGCSRARRDPLSLAVLARTGDPDRRALTELPVDPERARPRSGAAGRV